MINKYSWRPGAIRDRLIAIAVGVALCACASSRPQVATQRATAKFAASEREELFARALAVLERRGWRIATSDEAAGLITSEWTPTGMKPCGHSQCESKSMVQVSIATSGAVGVEIRRELDTTHIWMPSGREGFHNWQWYTSDWDAEELLADIRRSRGATRGGDAQ
jgi:hypothetical protein